MGSTNLGRVQGGGFFGSTSTSATSITKTTVQTNGVSPLVGDTIVNANGDLCRITAVTSTAYTVSKYASIKGATGNKGDKGDAGTNGTTPSLQAAAGGNINNTGTPTVKASTSGTTTTFTFDYLKGAKGDKGDKGADGTNGTDGSNGKDGTNGTNGATWTTGTSTPANTSGANGDLFLNTSTYDVYKKSSGSWSKIGNIKGAKGDPGDDGNDGGPGSKGDKGDPGTAAGFDTPSASATELTIGSAPTASVSASGTNQSKKFIFTFGIPTAPEKLVTVNGTKMSLPQFITNCENGNYTSIGTTATIEKCINGRTYTIRLIGTNHDSLMDQSSSGSTKAKTTWEFTNLVGYSRLGLPFDYMDYDSDNDAYWPSNMQGYLSANGMQTYLSNILASLPSELQRGIKFVGKDCYVNRDYIDQGSIGTYTYKEGCKLFLLSATEIGAGSSSSWPVEGSAYSYYSGLGTGSNTKRVKDYYGATSGNAYWLRSPSLDHTYLWCYVGDSGGIYCYYDTVNDYGVAPAFCI